MGLELQERKVLGLGLVYIPKEKWKDVSVDVLYEISDEDEKKSRFRGESYITKAIVLKEGLEIRYMFRSNPQDHDWPPLPLYDYKSEILKDEQIDIFFKLGCAFGNKSEIRRKV
jgi:hypothetical protein